MTSNEKGKYQNNLCRMVPYQRVQIRRKRSGMTQCTASVPSGEGHGTLRGGGNSQIPLLNVLLNYLGKDSQSLWVTLLKTERDVNISVTATSVQYTVDPYVNPCAVKICV